MMRSYLYAYADAHEMLMQQSEMLMHACNLGWGPPTMLLYFLLHGVIALALYKGLHAAEARPIQKDGCRAVPGSLAAYW